MLSVRTEVGTGVACRIAARYIVIEIKLYIEERIVDFPNTLHILWKYALAVTYWKVWLV